MKRLIMFVLVISSFLMAATSCQKEIDKTLSANEPISITSAQDWFTKSISSSGARLSADGFLNIKSINWGKADYYTFKFGKAVVVPLVYDKILTPVIEGNEEPTYGLTVNQLNSLVIFKGSDGKYHERIYKVYPENDYLIRSQGRKFKVPFSGQVVITDWRDNVITGYKYNEGVTTGRLVLEPSQQGARAKACSSIDWYTCASSDGGSSWYCHHTGTTTDCSYWCGACGNNPDPTIDYDGPGYYESGGGGTNDVNFVGADLASYGSLISDFDVVSDPLRPHITVTINKPCQGNALRSLVNNAQLAQVEYTNSMHQCLLAAGFATAAVDIINNGGFYKMIVNQMKNSGGKGANGYRAAMITLGFGSLAASVCVNDAYNILQAKYTQYESDFKVQYNTCN